MYILIIKLSNKFNLQIIQGQSTQPSKHLNHSQLLLQNIDYVVGIYLIYAMFIFNWKIHVGVTTINSYGLISIILDPST